MVGSFAYVARGPETTQQKVVQARMIAQFLTLILLGGSAYLSYDPAQAGKKPVSLGNISRRGGSGH